MLNIGKSTCLESHSSDKTFNVYKNIVIEVEEFDFGVKALKAEKFKACQVQRSGDKRPGLNFAISNLHIIGKLYKYFFAN